MMWRTGGWVVVCSVVDKEGSGWRLLWGLVAAKSNCRGCRRDEEGNGCWLLLLRSCKIFLFFSVDSDE